MSNSGFHLNKRFILLAFVSFVVAVFSFLPVRLTFSAEAFGGEEMCFADLDDALEYTGLPFETTALDNDGLKPKEIAKGYAVMERSSRRLLEGENIHEKLPMASTTKIITAIVAIENNPDLEKIIEIPKNATKIPEATIYLQEGEHLTIKELLFGLMVKSGNDAGVALAIVTSGSVEAFAQACNNFCAEIGAVNTHLMNPHGLHHDDHYTTAYDLALITSYALNNPTFRELVSTKEVRIPNEKMGGTRLLKNKNRMLSEFPGSTGVKTGFTNKAGRCLVSSAVNLDGMEVVVVVLNCPQMFEESTNLLDSALRNFKLVEIWAPYKEQAIVPVSFSREEQVHLFSKEGLVYPLSDEELALVRVVKEVPDYLNAPVFKDQPVGKVFAYLGNDLIFSQNLYSMEECKSIRLGDIFKRIVTASSKEIR